MFAYMWANSIFILGKLNDLKQHVFSRQNKVPEIKIYDVPNDLGPPTRTYGTLRGVQGARVCTQSCLKKSYSIRDSNSLLWNLSKKVATKGSETKLSDLLSDITWMTWSPSQPIINPSLLNTVLFRFSGIFKCNESPLAVSILAKVHV